MDASIISEAKTLARQACQPDLHDCDSEVECVPPLLKTGSGTQLPAGAYQCCGKQLPAMSSLESEHITLDAFDQCDHRQQHSAQAIGDSDTRRALNASELSSAVGNTQDQAVPD